MGGKERARITTSLCGPWTTSHGLECQSTFTGELGCLPHPLPYIYLHSITDCCLFALDFLAVGFWESFLSLSLPLFSPHSICAPLPSVSSAPQESLVSLLLVPLPLSKVVEKLSLELVIIIVAAVFCGLVWMDGPPPAPLFCNLHTRFSWSHLYLPTVQT